MQDLDFTAARIIVVKPITQRNSRMVLLKLYIAYTRRANMSAKERN